MCNFLITYTFFAITYVSSFKTFKKECLKLKSYKFNSYGQVR